MTGSFHLDEDRPAFCSLQEIGVNDRCVKITPIRQDHLPSRIDTDRRARRSPWPYDGLCTSNSELRGSVRPCRPEMGEGCYPTMTAAIEPVLARGRD